MTPSLVTALGLTLWDAQWQRSALAGLVHPVLGLDHFFALLGVGMWAGRLGHAAQ